MVYSTTLLLLVIVILLNIVAIFIRNRLRKKLAYGVF
jgi:ABC-type phosphate transport system permease subunit